MFRCRRLACVIAGVMSTSPCPVHAQHILPDSKSQSQLTDEFRTDHAARGACPASGDCCQAHGTPGCNDFDCCDAVCFVDSFCCEEEWDADCASFAALFCPPLCQPVIDCGQGDCCSINAAGCSDATCCELVCLLDISCCTTGWTASCSLLAREVCEGCLPTFDCPQTGDCCQAHPGSSGCERSACCQTVCEIDSACCTDGWSISCARTARENCPNICDCDSFGDFDANGQVDLRDVAAFQRCFSGNSLAPLPTACACSDYDGDGHANLTDLPALLDVLDGP